MWPPRMHQGRVLRHGRQQEERVLFETCQAGNGECQEQAVRPARVHQVGDLWHGRQQEGRVLLQARAAGYDRRREQEVALHHVPFFRSGRQQQAEFCWKNPERGMANMRVSNRTVNDVLAVEELILYCRVVGFHPLSGPFGVWDGVYDGEIPSS